MDECSQERKKGDNKFGIFFQEAVVVFQHKTHTYHLRNVLTVHSSAVLFPSYVQNNYSCASKFHSKWDAFNSVFCLT